MNNSAYYLTRRLNDLTSELDLARNAWYSGKTPSRLRRLIAAEEKLASYKAATA